MDKEVERRTIELMRRPRAVNRREAVAKGDGKPERKTKSTQFNFRCREEELQEFRRAAEREGFDAVASWILWHLRRIINQSK